MSTVADRTITPMGNEDRLTGVLASGRTVARGVGSSPGTGRRPGEVADVGPSASLAGNVVIVTGAAGDGIGAGAVTALLSAGAEVIAVDMDTSPLEGIDRVALVQGDVSDAETSERAVACALARHGRLDGLVNNAGVGLNRPFHLVEEGDFDRLYRVDVRAVWLFARALARHAVGAGTPASIVNVSSVHGRATTAGYALYAGAKAAVDGLTRGFAVEGGPWGIRCNAVAPGYVHAEQNLALIRGFADDPTAWVRQHQGDFQALDRQISREECGALVAFLLSDAAGSITGQSIAVDAGLSTQLYSHSFVRYP